MISLVVAFVFTPWMSNRMAPPAWRDKFEGARPRGGSMPACSVFDRVMSPFLLGSGGHRNRWPLAGILVLIAPVGIAAGGRTSPVILKMLPFDNKSEFQVVLDMPKAAVSNTPRAC